MVSHSITTETFQQIHSYIGSMKKAISSSSVNVWEVIHLSLCFLYIPQLYREPVNLKNSKWLLALSWLAWCATKAGEVWHQYRSKQTHLYRVHLSYTFPRFFPAPFPVSIIQQEGERWLGKQNHTSSGSMHCCPIWAGLVFSLYCHNMQHSPVVSHNDNLSIPTQHVGSTKVMRWRWLYRGLYFLTQASVINWDVDQPLTITTQCLQTRNVCCFAILQTNLIIWYTQFAFINKHSTGW